MKICLLELGKFQDTKVTKVYCFIEVLYTILMHRQIKENFSNIQ